MKKVIIYFLGIIFALALISAGLVFFYPDQKLKDYDDLIPKIDEVSESENGYKYLEEAVKLREDEKIDSDISCSDIVGYLEGEKRTYDEKLDDQYVGNFLSKNKEFFGLLDKTQKFKYLMSPGYQNFEKQNALTSLPDSSYFSPSTCLQARILYELKDGKTASALKHSLVLFDHNIKMMASGRQLIEYLMAATYLRKSEDLIVKVVTEYELGGSDYKKIIDKFSDEVDFKEYFTIAMKMRFISNLNDIDGFKNGFTDRFDEGPDFLAKSKYHFQVNKTKNIFIDYYGKLLAFNEDDRCYLVEFFADNFAKPVLPRLIWLFVSSNSYGKTVSASFLPLPDFDFERFTEDEFRYSAVKVVTALQWYRRENGQYPDSLSDLVPAYLDDVNDQFEYGLVGGTISSKKIVNKCASEKESLEQDSYVMKFK